jgi:beta-lactam-binding protein with PASTA domain
VLAQDPPGHAEGIAQPSINLLVAAANDDAADGFVMPDLTGLPIVSAQEELAAVGIHAATPNYLDVPVAPLGKGDAAPRPPVAPGAVIAQQPTAGSRVDQMTVVKLAVAK